MVTFEARLTGEPLHEWLGLALGGWIEDRRRTRKAKKVSRLTGDPIKYKTLAAEMSKSLLRVRS